MQLKPGTVPAKHAWSIMVAALVVVGGTAAATFGGSWIINAGVFIVGAFLSTFLTQISKTAAFGIWFLGSVLCAVVVFVLTMKFATHATHMATSAANLSGNGLAQTATHAADTAASVVGGVSGAIFAVISFFGTLVASTLGLIIGAIARPKLPAPPPPA